MTAAEHAADRLTLITPGTILAVVVLGAVQPGIFAAALPRIVTDLNGGRDVSWMNSAYLVSSTVAIPVYGRLSDVYGRRAMLLVATVLLLVGSAVCGAAQGIRQLIVFHSLQGLGAGGLAPLAQAGIADLFTPRDRGRYQGYVSGAWAVAILLGPLLGSALADHASWRWTFFANLPPAAFVLLVLLRAVPDRMRLTDRRIAKRRAPLEVFRSRIVAVSCGAALITGALLFEVTEHVPGVLMIPFSAGWLGASVTSGEIVSRTGGYRAFPIVGSSLVLLAIVSLTLMGSGSSSGATWACLAATGIGVGLMFHIHSIASQNAVTRAELGITSGMLNLCRSMGGTVAMTALGARHARHSAFAASVAIAAIGVALALALDERPLDTTFQSPEPGLREGGGDCQSGRAVPLPEGVTR